MVRVAAALLVQHPVLIHEIEDPDLLRELDLPGMDLFQSVVQLLKDHPRLNTAALIEHFRESEHQTALVRLATWTHPSLAQDVHAEFRGVLNQMRLAAIKAGTERLLQKQQLYGLDAGEKTELARLLAAKQEMRQAPPTH
jgi:DNA primase